MGKRTHQFKVDSLSRFLIYMLGHRPDEFGLVPDTDGFVTYKKLLQAIHEEPGWHYVRRSHINELLMGKNRHMFQPEEKRIRVLERRWQLDLHDPLRSLPKVLFTPVRRKAHPVVMEKGLNPVEGRYLVLSPDEEMALRIGKRHDQEPVLLEIPAEAAESKGVLFYAFGKLFLSPRIPAKFISGPPVSKGLLETPKSGQAIREQAGPRPVDFAPGTFSLDISRDPDLQRRARAKKRKGWKEDARKIRRGK